VRALDLGEAVDVVVDDQVVAEAVEVQPTVISGSSVVDQALVVLDTAAAADTEVPQLQPMAEALVAHLPKLLMAELPPTAVVVDMAVVDTETHQVAAANPGGNHSTMTLCSYSILFDSGTIHRPGTTASKGCWSWIRHHFSVFILLHPIICFSNALFTRQIRFSGGGTSTTKAGCCLLRRLA
jgi:hypothetical protein